MIKCDDRPKRISIYAMQHDESVIESLKGKKVRAGYTKSNRKGMSKSKRRMVKASRRRNRS